jgi:hypothetical protein
VEERSRNGGNDQRTTENTARMTRNDGHHEENIENVKDEDRFCSPTLYTSAVAAHER